MGYGLADRLKALPPYLFAEIDKKKKAAIAAGRDVINLGLGDPDTPTPAFVIEELARQAANSKNHQYALDSGLPDLRGAIAAWRCSTSHTSRIPKGKGEESEFAW